jgi:hypothetical protein
LLFCLTCRCSLGFFPLFKSGDKRNISSYRGISIFKKLVCDVVTPIIRPSISNEQHGFVGGLVVLRWLVFWSSLILSWVKWWTGFRSMRFIRTIRRLSIEWIMNHGLLLSTLTRKFRRPMILWMLYYYLSETIYYHSGVPHLIWVLVDGFSLMLMTWSYTCVLAALTIVVCLSRTVYRVSVVRRRVWLECWEVLIHLVFPWVGTGDVSICHWR